MSVEIIFKKVPFMTFNKGDETVGVMDYKDGKWFFEGEVDASAKVFIEEVLRHLPLPLENG